VFSAIIGRFLTAFTAWRLERGVEVAAVEYITGSRTVFGVISTPFRLRLLHNVLPLLLLLWALSPAGGQASLRAVAIKKTSLTEDVRVYYLDSLTQMYSDTVSIFGDTTKAVFISALLAPVSTKMGYRDLFGNMKVPLLEDFNAGPQFADEEGWYTTETEQTSAYSSLIGLSTMGLPTEGTTTLNIETSYMYSNCLLARRDDDTSGLNYNTSCHNRLNKGMTLALDADPEFNASDPSTAPRKIWFDSTAGALTAECSLTTTYVEIRYLCNGQSCAPTDVRRSKLPHKPTTITWLDGLSSNEWGSPAPIGFCPGFINATDMGTINFYSDSVLERYLANPDTAFSDVYASKALADLVNLSSHIFSRRFTQLMNTYWLAVTAPVSVSGAFTVPYPGDGHGDVSNTTSEWRTTKDVLDYDTTWLAVLMASSLVMLAAGIATVALNLVRRGPEVLDSFTSMLRENQYVQEETGPSTEDASEKVRRLRKTKVMLGDVHLLEMIGHVAVTTRTDGDSVQPLRSGRLYY
jgi:hypothetical protein